MEVLTYPEASTTGFDSTKLARDSLAAATSNTTGCAKDAWLANRRHQSPAPPEVTAGEHDHED